MADKPVPRVAVSWSEADQLREARRIVRDEASVLNQLADVLSTSFCDALSLLQQAEGNVIITGVGKAGLIGQKLVATLSSTGTRARFLHPTEALHGDLGCLCPGDVVMILSNSGESDEILRLLPILRKLRIPVIAITRDEQNSLARAASVVIAFGRHREAGELGLAPTCTTTAMLATGDALALVLSQMRGFTATDFAVFHPAGSLGRQLTPVREVMRTGQQLRMANETETVRQIMIRHSQPGRRTGAVILTSPNGVLTGLFTDSDLARLFESRRDEQLDQPICKVMTVNPVTISPDALLPEAIRVMSARKLSELPVINSLHIPVGMLDITDILQQMDSGSTVDESPGLKYLTPCDLTPCEREAA